MHATAKHPNYIIKEVIYAWEDFYTENINQILLRKVAEEQYLNLGETI